MNQPQDTGSQETRLDAKIKHMQRVSKLRQRQSRQPPAPSPAQQHAQHSPLPWRIASHRAGRCCIVCKHPKNWKPTPQHPDYIVAQSNLYVCVPNDEQQANALFIVEACNNYERVTAELERVKAQLKQAQGL